MKQIIALLLLLLLSFGAVAGDVYVNGYYRQDGTYVEPHYRSAPNQYKFDNYSSQGNTNPYTGKRGYERNEFSNPPIYYNNQNIPMLTEPIRPEGWSPGVNIKPPSR